MWLHVAACGAPLLCRDLPTVLEVADADKNTQHWHHSDALFETHRMVRLSREMSVLD